MGKKIVLVQAGWVFMGEYERTGDCVVLRAASCIRRWGTTNGIGEIALCGPTEDTVLDKCGTVTIPLTSVLGIIDCVE